MSCASRIVLVAGCVLAIGIPLFTTGSPGGAVIVCLLLTGATVALLEWWKQKQKAEEAARTAAEAQKQKEIEDILGDWVNK